MTFEWTAGTIDKFRALVADGLTASQIAIKLRAPSRNSIIGKAHRLGLKIGRGEKQWTAETDATLRRLWTEGLSTRQIASQLKLQSSSNVSWRAAEIGLDPRRQGSTLKVKPTLSPVAAPEPMPQPVVVKPLAEPKPASVAHIATGRVHILDVEFGQCRFPEWPSYERVPLEAKFYCGDATGGPPYCAHHAARCNGIGSASERNAHRRAA